MLFINLYIIYIIAYFLLFKNRKLWEGFTRIVSTLNALQCVYMVYYETFQYHHNSMGMVDLYYVANDYSLNILYSFSYYLFVDGLFQLLDLKEKFSFSLILSILHHFVGGLGIYLIADAKMGFFLGYYFAMTEISTPFLNLSWLFRESSWLFRESSWLFRESSWLFRESSWFFLKIQKILFLIFYILFFLSRILTIPFLLEYLSNNTEFIMILNPIQIIMSFYGSYALISLNIIWFAFMSKKMVS